MKKQIQLQGLILAASLLLCWSCSKKSSGYTTNTGGGNNNSNSVSIANMSFNSSDISITKGVTVTWTNDDNMLHTVTADDNSFTSGYLNKGDTYSHTFNNLGTFGYHCAVHAGMKASVEVKY